MIINGKKLLELAPIKDMASQKHHSHGVSWGLAEAGYDIRIKQKVIFKNDAWGPGSGRTVATKWTEEDGTRMGNVWKGRFVLASAIEEFDMPNCLVGIVHDKSTWARRGLSVFNTVIEPGFRGGLTLELVFHGDGELIIPAGSGIAQVLFHTIAEPAEYAGKYQFQSTDPEPARDQENKPVPAKRAK